MSTRREKELARSEAHEALTRSIVRVLERGQVVPCVGSSAWISDHPRLQSEATRKCLDCPLIQQCGDYATENEEQGGVWGGAYRTGPRQYAPRGGRGRHGNESRPNRAA